MEKLRTKIWLRFLRGLVYPKRAVVWLWHRAVPAADWLGERYRRTIGFYIYKLVFLLKKKLAGVMTPWGGEAQNWFGRRGVLQIIGLLIGLGIMLPQSKLWSTNGVEIPGRQTLLYQLVGPGDQNFDVQEITAQTVEQVAVRSTRNWREGAIAAAPASSQYAQIVYESGIARQSLGGTAFMKPTIIPGSVVPNQSVAVGTISERSDIAIYEVQPGDVLGAIARRFGVSVTSILAANNLTLRSYIRPGDKLKILPVDGVLHVIKKGDTIAKIAKFYQATSDDIIQINKLDAGAALTPGVELIVPHGVKPSPPVIARTPSRRFTVLDPVAAPPGSNDSPTVAGYIWPAAVHRITQYFGLRHTGVDIAGPIGTPVYAARSGTIVKAQCGWNGGYGCYIIIDHSGGIQSVYGHNSQIMVEVGDEVIQGQTISLMGSTGHSTGPHVHFEIRANGRRVNPLKYIR